MFAVPPKKPIIHDANGRKMTSTLGPYKVGEKLIATCVTSAGNYFLHLIFKRSFFTSEKSEKKIMQINFSSQNNISSVDCNFLHGCKRKQEI